MSLTPEQILDIEKRAEAATPGNWRTEECHSPACWCRMVISDHRITEPPFKGEFATIAPSGSLTKDDAEFIASCKQDIPALIADLRAARELLDEAEGVIAQYAPGFDVLLDKLEAFLRGGADETAE